MLFSVFNSFESFIFFTVAIVVAITIHEFSHAWMATLLGDSTAKMSGRLTLNPISHVDPLGMMVLFLAGFGWGKPVPYNPHFVRNGLWGEVGIALAGPASNILLAMLLGLPGRIYFWQTGIILEGKIIEFLAMLIWINVILAAFNLIPIPPLDGSKILKLIADKLSFGGVDWWPTFERVGPQILLLIIIFDRIANIGIISALLEPIIFFINWIIGSSSLLF